MNRQPESHDKGAVVTVDYIVAEMLNELEDYSTTQKQRLTGLIISAIRQIRLLEKSSIQVAYLTINEAGIIPFPSDMIDYIDIGLPMVNGQLYHLTEDNNMLLDRSTECGQDARQMVNYTGDNGFDYISPNWVSVNQFTPTWYGTRFVSRGYYRVDETVRQIQFNGRIPNGEVCLVYKSSGISQNTLIPATMINAVKKIAHYERILYKLDVPANQKTLLKVEKKEAIFELRRLTQKFTLAEYKQTIYKSKRQTPKP